MHRYSERLFEWKRRLWATLSAGSWQGCSVWVFSGISVDQQPSPLYPYVLHSTLLCNAIMLKVGFHYPSSRAELTARELGCIFWHPSTRVVETGRPCTWAVYTGVRFPLPELTARVDGCQKMHPSSRAVNSGSGNRPLLYLLTNGWPGWVDVGGWLHSEMLNPPVVVETVEHLHWFRQNDALLLSQFATGLEHSCSI